MGTTNENITTSTKYRYSIPSLLDIAHRTRATFDISKLSAEAYQATTVFAPVINRRGLTMPLYEISGNRTRGGSLDTVSSAEDNVVFPGSNIRHPHRQPDNGPREPRSQKDEGFARFLKKHSSPTHQRVTAGGRIVPMSRTPAPPQFALLIDRIAGSGASSSHRKGDDSQGLRQIQSSTRDVAEKQNEENEACTGYTTNLNANQSSNLEFHTDPFPVFLGSQVDGNNVEERSPISNIPGATVPNKVVSNAAGLIARPLQVGPSNVSNTNEAYRALDKPDSNNGSVLGQNPNPTSHSFIQVPVFDQCGQDQTAAVSTYTPYMIPALDDRNLFGQGLLFGSQQGQSTSYQTVAPNGAPSFAQYPMLGLAGDQLVMYPNFIPMPNMAFQLSQAALPFYAGQAGLWSPVTGAANGFNMSTTSGAVLQPNPPAGAVIPMSTPMTNTLVPLLSVEMNPNAAMTQQLLLIAKADYDGLSNQLEELDKYTAVHRDSLDAESRCVYSQQRMKIVERRAVAKQNMNRLKAELESAPTAPPLALTPPSQQKVGSTQSAAQSRPTGTSSLNVQAAAWVPRTQVSVDNTAQASKRVSSMLSNPGQKGSPTKDDIPKQNSLSSGGGIDAKPVISLKLDASLPSLLPSIGTSGDPFTDMPETSHRDRGSREASPVDEWGQRLGKPSPELEREQNERSQKLEAMAGVRIQASDILTFKEPSKQSDIMLPARQAQGSKASTEEDIDQCDSMSIASSEHDGWMPEKRGRAPPEVEHDYELILDALRASKGVTTSVLMSNGGKIDIEGQNLQRPAWKHMNGFEKKYWKKRPDQVFSHYGNVGTATSSHAFNEIPTEECSQLSENSWRSFYSGHRHHRNHHSPNPSSQHMETYNDRISPLHASNAAPKIPTMFNGASKKNGSVPPPKPIPQHAEMDNGYGRVQNMVERLEEIPKKQLSPALTSWTLNGQFDINRNKSQSSVAIQSVTAVSDFSSSFDGAADILGRRLPMPALASAETSNDHKASTVVQPSKRIRNPWFGAIRRGFLSPTVEEAKIGSEHKFTQAL